MRTLYRLRLCLVMLPLVALVGCNLLSSGPSDRPSPFDKPPTLPPEPKHDIQGGFAVLVELPDEPTAARVVADLGTFAQGCGFVRQSDAQTSPQLLVRGKIALEVTYLPAQYRVTAFLHSPGPGGDRKFIEQFCRDFRRDYGKRYGTDGTIIDNDSSNRPR